MSISVLKAFPDQPGITAFFTTRQGGRSPGPFHSLNLGIKTEDKKENIEKNWHDLFDSFNWKLSNLRFPNLVHGSHLVSGKDCFPIPGTTEADGIYTRDSNLVLTVTMADCLPILLFDPILRTVAAIHAGWKGTHQAILGKALSILFEKNLIEKKSVQLAFGPCIGNSVYAVKTDVAQHFDKKFLKKAGENKFYLDLYQANLQQAKNFGISDKNAHHFQGCTFSESERFYSFRRDGANSGRMAAVIKLA